MVRRGPPGGGAILIVAYYDSVPAGPGAGDDGAGVASLLEIAALIRNEPLSKPIIFLFSDGEEAGLLGAASFVRTDPHAKDVAFAINLEARGTGGPAIMFQTSTPNAGPIATFADNPFRPVANSLAADIYRSLPNDTDATEFLAKGYGVLNYAFIEPLARYHTPTDSLAYLSHDSVGHLGGSALQVVRSYLAEPPQKAARTEGLIYSDVLGRGLLVLPQFSGYVLLAFGFAAAIARFAQTGGGFVVRAFLMPPLAMITAGSLAFVALFLISHFRSEVAWWTAEPRAVMALIGCAALIGSTVALAMAKAAETERLIASGWLWLLALAGAASLVSPGSMILTTPGAGIFALMVLARALFRAVPRWVFLLPAFAVLAMILPTLSFAGSALGYDIGWVVAALVSLLFVLVLGLFSGATRGGLPAGAITVPSLALLLAAAWSVTAPAYSAATPRQLSVQHWEGADFESQFLLSPSTEPVPATLAAVAPFSRKPVVGFGTPQLSAPAPSTGDVPPEVKVISDVARVAVRTVTLQIETDDVDRVAVVVPEAAAMTQVKLGSETFAFKANGPKEFRCTGRACQSWRITAIVGATRTKWTIRSIRFGLDPSGRVIAAQRPVSVVPVQTGDVRVSTRDVEL